VEKQTLYVPSPKLDPLADKENKLDPYKKKRKRLRKELRGMSVQDLCSGLSPGTLATMRAPSLKVKPTMSPIRRVVSPKGRRHSTDNSIVDDAFWRKQFKLSDVQPDKLAVFVNGDKEESSGSNLTVELIEEQRVDENTPAPVVVHTVQPKKSSSGLRKMVKKLF